MKSTNVILLLFTLLNLFFPISAVSATFKIATLSPDGSYWMIRLREAGLEVEKQTSGRVKFKYYPGGVMGDDKAVLRKMRINQLQGGALTSNAFTSFYNDIQIYNLLNTFKSLEEVDYVRSRMDIDLLRGLEEGGVVPLGLSEIGFAYIMSLKKITSVQDIRLTKSWVPDNDSTALESIKSFGISPIPLPFADVLLGLQSGMIETVAASPLAAIALQWHTQIKYVSDMPLLYIFGIFALDQKAFNKLQAPDQVIVRNVFSMALKDIDSRNRKDNLNAIDALKNNNIQFTNPSEDGMREFSTLSVRANTALITNGNISSAINEKLVKLLNDYHSQIVLEP